MTRNSALKGASQSGASVGGMRLAGTVLAAVALVALPGSAGAGFPGRNGAIVVSSNQSTVGSGEVYAVRTDGGGRVNLTRNPAADLEAVWSPDGTSVAFTRDGSVAVMAADGSGQLMLGAGTEPAWSPDGHRLAFVRDGTIWTSTPVGTGAQQLTAGPGDSWPRWSPDGSRIAFARGSGFLGVVPASGGTVAELARGVADGPSSFVWTRDGGALLYGNAYVLYRVSADGASDDLLLRAPATIASLALSPNGLTLAFSVGAYGSPGSGGVWTYDLGAQAARQVTMSLMQQDSLLTWSPRGDAIAFVRSGDVRIHVVSARGDAARTVPPEHPGTTFDSLAWSPDGTELLFSSTFSDDDELYSMTPSGGLSGPQTRLTTNWAEDVDPAWSPDGSTILFASDRSGEFEIYTMRADGSHARRLTREPGDDRSPAWSPDGSQIVFSTDRLVSAVERKRKREGYQIAHLYVMRADGSHLRRLTRGPSADDVTPAWSPDGRTIMFSYGASDPPKLETISADGTGRRDTGQTGTDPDWAPSGRELAFLHVYYPDGFRHRRGSPPPQVELALMLPTGTQIGSLGNHAGARWSPDGTQLAVADGAVIERSGARLATIPSGESSWQPICTVTGDEHANVLRVRTAGALVCGLGGNDRIVSMRGGDRLFGGAGDDTIEARNGRFDVIGCGPGLDSVVADPVDRVGVDCERVTR
jgi:Tol biopolymer transport system component